MKIEAQATGSKATGFSHWTQRTTPAYVKVTHCTFGHTDVLPLAEAAELLGYTPHVLRCLLARGGGFIERRTFSVERLSKVGEAIPEIVKQSKGA